MALVLSSFWNNIFNHLVKDVICMSSHEMPWLFVLMFFQAELMNTILSKNEKEAKCTTTFLCRVSICMNSDQNFMNIFVKSLLNWCKTRATNFTFELLLLSCNIVLGLANWFMKKIPDICPIWQGIRLILWSKPGIYSIFASFAAISEQVLGSRPVWRQFHIWLGPNK